MQTQYYSDYFDDFSHFNLTHIFYRYMIGIHIYELRSKIYPKLRKLTIVKLCVKITDFKISYMYEYVYITHFY